MKRRTFLAASAAAAVPGYAQLKPFPPRGLKLSITCDMFRGPDRGLPEDTHKPEAWGRPAQGVRQRKYTPERDHPGRHEPGTGEIHHRNVFRQIYELQQAGKFDGFVGLEYHPIVPLGQTLGAVRELANLG